jgi:hypothetical protein
MAHEHHQRRQIDQHQQGGLAVGPETPGKLLELRHGQQQERRGDRGRARQPDLTSEHECHRDAQRVEQSLDGASDGQRIPRHEERQRPGFHGHRPSLDAQVGQR